MRDPFFITGLAEQLLGDELHDVTERAREFVAPELFEHAVAIRQAFHDGGRVKHVVLRDALRPAIARAIGEALRAARFHRHHHRAYHLDIAALPALRPSALTRFCAWLASDDAALFHGWLAGWPARHPRQVQVARARRGDEFEVHVDMTDEGLAAVYNFTRGFTARDGGELYFPHEGRVELLVPPRFNTLALFRPRAAPHGVRRVTAHKARYTVTSFFTA